MESPLFQTTARIALALAVTVVLLGAYVRLSNAGLGCPDWPGCYGELVVPEQAGGYPGRPLVHGKAWKEMVHRYAAGTLGLLILGLWLTALRGAAPARRGPATLLLGLVLFQALLGMWTVTLKLHPLVVMGHLLGGFSVVGLLLWSGFERDRQRFAFTVPSAIRFRLRLGLAVVILQVVLGGWTSANYAAPACTDFPTCHGSWWPQMSFSDALRPPPPPAVGDYEGGTLEAPARTAIHFSHRLGAVVTLLVILSAAVPMLRLSPAAGRWGLLLAAAVAVQFSLGVANILFRFPLGVAVMHNGGALALLLSVLAANLCLRAEPAPGWRKAVGATSFP